MIDHKARPGLRLLPATLGVLVSCGGGIAARGPAPAADPVATNVTAPDGVALAPECVPSGPEECFNAIDDNCNGVIDEGCGEPTGPLQFTIAWGAVPADVNLSLVLPNGQRIPDGKTRTANGFTIDRDCPSSDRCRNQNVENLYYEGSGPERGHYNVEVTLADLRDATAPVAVRFGGRLWQRIVGFDLQLSPGDAAKKTLSFDVP